MAAQGGLSVVENGIKHLLSKAIWTNVIYCLLQQQKLLIAWKWNHCVYEKEVYHLSRFWGWGWKQELKLASSINKKILTKPKKKILKSWNKIWEYFLPTAGSHSFSFFPSPLLLHPLTDGASSVSLIPGDIVLIRAAVTHHCTAAPVVNPGRAIGTGRLLKQAEPSPVVPGDSLCELRLRF